MSHGGGGSGGWKDLVNGAVLQCVEAATLGMPFEVWKTRMGRFRTESTAQAFVNVYKNGGVTAFWAGLSPKLVESASKGAVLLWSKELLKDSALSLGISPTMAGFLAGAGGGVCQVTVMGPCTFLVTAVVTAKGDMTTSQRIRSVWAKDGIKGFYPGGVAIAFRQATNWASRQGFTDATRQFFKKVFYKDDPKAKLTVPEEALAGIIGGTLACWNHPFEVARIEMQARSVAGQEKMGMIQVFKHVVKENGIAGLFKGIIPRVGLGIWQTLFMVTGATLIKERLLK